MHLRSPNSYIDTAMREWQKLHNIIGNMPRQRSPLLANNNEHVAGTSSFGMSGINAHMLLQEASFDTKEVHKRFPKTHYDSYMFQSIITPSYWLLSTTILLAFQLPPATHALYMVYASMKVYKWVRIAEHHKPHNIPAQKILALVGDEPFGRSLHSLGE